jgi:hypothetical protein
MPSRTVEVCPLCGSLIPREKFLKIIGVWREKQKVEGELRRRLKHLKDEEIRLREDRRQMLRDMKSVLATKVKAAAEKARTHEKRRAERLSQMIQGKTTQIQVLSRKVRELQEQLKHGTTPQVEGINYELELVKDLKKNFPKDKIEHHGKGGDILHAVVHKSKEIGRILFECKKTSQFSQSYIAQTRLALAKRSATYGVLVTHAMKKGTAGFWVEDGILVVHPFGAVHVAGVLRGSMIELFATDITAREANRRAMALMDYMRGDDFKRLVEDTIFRTRQLYEGLKKEIRNHKKIWMQRYEHYFNVYHNSAELKQSTANILHGAKPARLAKTDMKLLPPPM